MGKWGAHHEKSKHKQVEKGVPRARGTCYRCQSPRTERKLSEAMIEGLAAVMENAYMWGDININVKLILIQIYININIYTYVNIKNNWSPVCLCQRRVLQIRKGRITQ